MARAIRRTIGGLATILAIAFLAFLYFMPPFFVAPPETFSKDVAPNTPGVAGIAGPAERAIAARGRYIVMATGCVGCHGTPGAQGPRWDMYLAGGLRFDTLHGAIVSRNLTPDRATGIGRRTDAEIARVLQSGVFPDGHVVSHTVMPFASFSNWTEEDRRAVIAYLRHLGPVAHQIPDPTTAPSVTVPGAVEEAYGGHDHGTTPR